MSMIQSSKVILPAVKVTHCTDVVDQHERDLIMDLIDDIGAMRHFTAGKITLLD